MGGTVAVGRWTLQRRTIGMNKVLSKDIARILWADQTIRRGNAQMYRPNRSPTLNATKWTAAKRSGCTFGFVGSTETVMEGYMAWSRQ